MIISQADKDYDIELGKLNDPDDSIDYAVSAKLLTESKAGEATWLAESITEQDSEMLMANVRQYLDGRNAETAIELADAIAVQLCDYMATTIESDREALEPDTALPEDMVDYVEEMLIAREDVSYVA